MEECLEYLEWINALLDGETTPQQEALLEAHLADCPRCRALFHDLTALHQGAVALVVPPPAGFSARVMAEVAQAVPAKKKVVHLGSWRSLGALAAVCALALLGSGALRYFQEGQQPRDIPSQVAVSPAAYGGEASPLPEALEGGKQSFSIPVPTGEGTGEEGLPRMALPSPQVNSGLLGAGAPSPNPQPDSYIGMPVPVTPEEALDLLLEHIHGDLGVALEIEPLDNDEIGYTLRSADVLRYTDRSPNGLYYCFTWEQDGGETAYAVSLTGQSILCETDAADGGESFHNTLEK